MLQKINIIIYLILIFLSYSQAQVKSNDPKNILVLFSLNQGLISYQMILENFRNILRDEYDKPFKLYFEYLDVGKFPDLGYQEYLFEQINEKYKHTNFDLLICVGPGLIPLLDKYAATYITHLPTISLDLKNPFNNNINYSLHPKTKEILLNIDAKKNFELAFSLFPEYSNVFVISGVSAVDLFFNKIAMSAAQEYNQSKNIKNLTDLSMEELLNEVTDIPEKSIIIVASFLSDANNVTFNTPEVIRLITKRSSAPILTFFDTPFEEGILGGYVASFANLGMETGKAAMKILNGEEPKSVIIDEEKLNQYMFDWKELKRMNLINSNFIPENSIILNEEVDFISKYKWFLSIGITFLILQSLLVVNLLRLNKKQKLMTHQIIESENRYRELVHEDRLQRMSELTASLSHELNQPLTAILTSAQAGLRFLNSNKSDSETIKEIFQNIVEDDKRAASVISSVRSMMKLERREKEIVEVNSLIEEVIKIFKGEASKQKIKLELNLPKNPVFISADPIQIQQVLLNFLFNASHSMEDIEPEEKAIIITGVLSENNVIVQVRDYGIGIKDEIKDKIFKPFTTTRAKGFGIGLAVSKSIIESHQGKIKAENNPDGGATFSFELKLWQNEK